ncbi:MAG TPA: UDP-N-acetylmuramoyl-tripeptide--D-alanyl-D-alanine ligase [Sphingomonadaceae bacterium]
MGALPKILSWLVQPSDELPLALWDAAAVAAATGGRASCAFQAAGVEIDSRDVVEGDLFFALKGETSHGHAYLDKAFANGAAAAVVDRPIAQPHVLVQDTTAALQRLGMAARDRADAKVVGVTGSVGKTGVKEALFAALDRASRGAAHRSVRSYNNHVGVPLSLARMSARAKYGVFEMGMNHAGEIAALTRQVRPHVAVITAIAPAHIEMLGSEEAIAAAKAEIFLGLQPGGTAVIPADSPHYERLREAALAEGAEVAAFGKAAHAQVRLLDAVQQANGGSLVTADLGDRRICYSVAEPGEHWVSNSLAVIAAVRALGADLGAAGLALAEMGSLKGRGARHRISVRGGQATLIDESYNANPASMRATLAQLGQTPATRRIAVLGSMKELGDFGPRFHAALVEPLYAANVDYAVLVGGEMQPLADELGKVAAEALGKPIRFAHCDNPADAIAALEDYGLEGGDAVLVKGSNSVGLARLVAHFVGRGAGHKEG